MALNDKDRYKVLDCERKAVLGLPDGAFKVWHGYWMFQNEAGLSFPGNNALLAFTRQTEPTLKKWRNYLVASRWLVSTGQTAADMYAHATRGAHRIKVYRVNDPTKEPDWKGWAYWDQWLSDNNDAESGNGDAEHPVSERSAAAQQPPANGGNGRQVPDLLDNPSLEAKNLPQDDVLDQNVFPKKSFPNIGVKKLPQSSFLSLSSSSGLPSDLDSHSESARSLAHPAAPQPPQPACESPFPASQGNPQPEDRIKDNPNTEGALPPLATLAPPLCEGTGVSEFKSKSPYFFVPSGEELDPEFAKITPETLCDDCELPLGKHGAGESRSSMEIVIGGNAAHGRCTAMSREQWLWWMGKVVVKDSNWDNVLPARYRKPKSKATAAPVARQAQGTVKAVSRQTQDDLDSAPAKPPLVDHLQETIDKLKTEVTDSGKHFKQYAPDGANYPDSWYRMSAEERRVWIKSHKRPRRKGA